eukprot:17534-Heterococcus_DN1.PRE.2
MADYSLAFKHIIDVFRNNRANVIWQLGSAQSRLYSYRITIGRPGICNDSIDFNSRHGLDNTRPFADYFPWGVAGDIQQVAITCYNRAYLKPSQQFTQTFKQAFTQAYNEVPTVAVAIAAAVAIMTACLKLSKLTDKPMIVAETSTVSGHDVNKGKLVTAVTDRDDNTHSLYFDHINIALLNYRYMSEEGQVSTQIHRQHAISVISIMRHVATNVASCQQCVCYTMYLDWDIGTEAQRKNFISGYWDLQYITTHGRRLLSELWHTTDEVDETVKDVTVNDVTAGLVPAGN